MYITRHPFLFSLLIIYRLLRRFAFKKVLIFKCNHTYEVSNDFDNSVLIKGETFIKERKINDLESILYPKLSRYFVSDVKKLRKIKLKKIRF